MSYFTLDEAAEWLTRTLGGTEVLGAPVTAAQVLRYGIHGHLLICVALDTRCYSPTVKVRNQAAARAQDPDGWFREDVSGQKAVEAATVEVFGLFVVPVRTLFAFEVGDEVMLQFVTSLDGSNSYHPFEKIGRDRLRVLVPHLEAFASSVQLVAQEAGSLRKEWTEAEKMALLNALEAGQSRAALAQQHNVSRQRIDQLVKSIAPKAPTANNPFSLSKPRRIK